MVNRTDFEPIIIDDFIHDPINQEKVQSYPPELVGRFNSFIVTAFDDSMTVEMQIRTLIKWIKENIDVTMSALDNMEAFKQDSMAFQNHVKDTLVNLINNFTDKFDDNLKFETLEILNQWFEDGVLSDLVRIAINEEVINARGDKTTLGQRLDDTDEKFTQIVYQKHPIIEKLLEEPTIMAHRGLYRVFPENTISAFYSCYKAGITFFETDFRKTIDGYWVCHHDPSTMRLTGVDLDIASSTLSEIRKLDITKGANSRMYGNPKIPTIDEVFNFIKNTGCIVNINFDYGIAIEDIPIIVDKIYSYGIQNNVICQGQNWQDVDSTLCISNGGYIGVSEERFKEAQLKGNMIASYGYGYSGDVQSTERIMKLASKYSVPVIIYTVETYGAFKALDPTGVNCMMVDYLWFRN